MGGGCDEDPWTGDVMPDRADSRDWRAEEVGVSEGRRRRGVDGSRGEAIVDIVCVVFGCEVVIGDGGVDGPWCLSWSWCGHL